MYLFSTVSSVTLPALKNADCFEIFYFVGLSTFP